MLMDICVSSLFSMLSSSQGPCISSSDGLVSFSLRKVASGVSYLCLLRQECDPCPFLHLLKGLLNLFPFSQHAIYPDRLMCLAVDKPHFLLPLIPVHSLGSTLAICKHTIVLSQTQCSSNVSCLMVLF